MNKVAHSFLIALSVAVLMMVASLAFSRPGTPPLCDIRIQHAMQDSTAHPVSTTGKLTVSVFNDSTGEKLTYGTAQLLETRQGALVKPNKSAQIINVKPGVYSVLITSVGYHCDTIGNVSVVAGKSSPISAYLKRKNQTKITLPHRNTYKEVGNIYHLVFTDSIIQRAMVGSTRIKNSDSLIKKIVNHHKELSLTSES